MGKLKEEALELRVLMRTGFSPWGPICVCNLCILLQVEIIAVKQPVASQQES